MTVFIWAVVGVVVGMLPAARLVIGHPVRRDQESLTLTLRRAGHLRSAMAVVVVEATKAFVVVFLATRVSGAYEASAAGIGAVAGHLWSPFFKSYLGPALAVGAGALLAVVPFEVSAGLALMGIGAMAGWPGFASTAGLTVTGLLSAMRGQPSEYQLLAWVILILILVARFDQLRGRATGRQLAGRVLSGL